MPPRRSYPDPDEEDDEEESSRRHLRSTGTRSSGRRGRHPPLRRWDTDNDEEEEEEDAEDSPRSQRGGARGSSSDRPEKEPVYFRARDSVYFEPLIALAIIVVLLVSLFAYTQNWPPMYVVESNSMQHGTTDQLGLINTGDLVLATKVSVSQITPYVVGSETGYVTYGEYGDVILYHPNGLTSGAPIIHRALLYIEVNPDHTDNLPSLAGQPCGAQPNAVYSIAPSVTGCGTSHVTGTLTLFNVGWRPVKVAIDLSSVGTSSGFLTMGDNNFNPSNGSIGDPDQPSLSNLVQAPWIVGVARGMLPWFGSLKLLLDGNAGEVPAQSWEWMGLSVVGLILVAIGVHSFLRAEGIEDERRKEEEEGARAREGPRTRHGRWHWPHPLRNWGEDDEEDEGEEPPRRHRGSKEPAGRRSWFGGGRPKPQVGRAPRHHPRGRDSDDDL